MTKEMYEFDNLLIIRDYYGGWGFEVTDDLFEHVICSSRWDLLFEPFSDFDTCFRAARKWMRDNQELIYAS